MSELLSKEVGEISEICRKSIYDLWHKWRGEFGQAHMQKFVATDIDSALRSVLLLAAKETCQLCAYEIPIIEGTSYHAILKRGKEQLLILCAAAPIHKMLRGEK